tara:strand:- start:211 stop:1326 length:1116 start_codon:yes stop_codon:yes gene_type:complete
MRPILPMTVKSGLYDKPDNVVCLPDRWNGDRWIEYLIKGSKDNLNVDVIRKSYKKFGIACAFLSIRIKNDFIADVDGKPFQYKKGMRLLLDLNRRKRAIVLMQQNGEDWITPEGNLNLLPIVDITDMVEHHFGEIKDMMTDGKDKVFKYLLVYNHLQQIFTDRSIIIGGSYCKLEDIERGKFEYFRQQLDTYGGNNTKLTDITILSCIYGNRGHLSSNEKDATSLDWEDTKTNRGIAKANLSLGYLIKQNMGGRMKQPLIQELMKQLHDATEEGYMLHQEREELVRKNKPVTEIIKSSMRFDCFPLPHKDDDSFIETYKNYLESIGKYFVEVWIKELEEKNLKISSIKNEATHRIEERVSDMWDFYLKKSA